MKMFKEASVYSKQTSTHRRLIPVLLSASLLACQAGPGGIIPTSKTPVSQGALSLSKTDTHFKGWRRLARPKALAPAASATQLSRPAALQPPSLPALQARIERRGNQELLSFRAQPRADFKTQAADLSGLNGVEIKVYGPGLSSPISSGTVSLTTAGVIDTADLANITLDPIPLGGPRVVVLQYLDDGVPVSWAAAADFYIPSSKGASRALNFERRKLPLARIFIDLFNSSEHAGLLQDLDLNALQAELDAVLGSLTGSPPRYSGVDPELVDVSKFVTDLVNAAGSVSTLISDGSYDRESYKITAPSLTLTIQGLTHNLASGSIPEFSDLAEVRLGDTSSRAQPEASNGNTVITNIVPGTWPLDVYLPAGVSYSILASSSEEFETATVTSLADGRTRISTSVEITGATPLELHLERKAPTISGISVPQGTRGATIEIYGEDFHPEAAGNQVLFQWNDDFGFCATDCGPFAAEVVSSDPDSKLLVKVPQIPNSGHYRVQVGYSDTNAAGTPELVLAQEDPYEQPDFEVTTVWYVKPDGSEGADGDDWDKAVPLDDALARAGAGDQLWIQEGTYTPGHIMVYDEGTQEFSPEVPTDRRKASFTIVKGITLLGGFAGTEESTDQRNPIAHPVVLSGDLDHDDNLSSPPSAEELHPDWGTRDDNSHNVVTVWGGDWDNEVLIDGITIWGGNASDSEDDTLIYSEEGCDPELDEDCYVMETAYNVFKHGGGIYHEGFMSLMNVTLQANSARGHGGAIFIGNADARFSMTSENYTGDDGAYGGLRLGRLNYNLLEDNLALLDGGGIYDLSGSRPSATILRRNHAGRDGGGFYAGPGFEGTNELQDFIFEHNQAGRNGGGYASTQNNIAFRRSVFANNQAEQFGGGVYFESSGGSGQISGSHNVFALNSAQKGGALYYSVPKLGWYDAGDRTLTHATFYNNQASESGDAIYIFGLRGLNLLNSILFNNDLARDNNDIGFTLDHSAADTASVSSTAFTDNGNNLLNQSAEALFSSTTSLAGSQGWASEDDGLRPPSDSPLKGVASHQSEPTADLLGIEYPGSPTIGAYEAH